jgi:predicted ArsR family transcriptional regulator
MKIMRIWFLKKENTKRRRSTKEAILNYLRAHENSSLGEIVMNLSLSYTEGLNNLLELKNEGKVTNNSSPFKYRVAGL